MPFRLQPAADRFWEAGGLARLFRRFDHVGQSHMHAQRPVFLIIGWQAAPGRDLHFGELRIGP